MNRIDHVLSHLTCVVCATQSEDGKYSFIRGSRFATIKAPMTNGAIKKIIAALRLKTSLQEIERMPPSPAVALLSIESLRYVEKNVNVDRNLRAVCGQLIQSHDIPSTLKTGAYMVARHA